MDSITIVIAILGILLAIFFNVCNGRNDAANTIAISLATHAMKPRLAIIIASIFCFIGPFVFSTAVASTIGKGIIDTSLLSPLLLLVSLCGAILWVSLCSRFGLPVSSSHAMIGGLLGAGIAAGGFAAIVFPSADTVFLMLFYLAIGAAIGAIIFLVLALLFHDSVIRFLILGVITGAVFALPISMIFFGFAFGGILAIIIFIFVSPLLGFLISYIVTIIVMRISSRISKSPAKMNKWFKRLQVVGSAFQALSLGGNDAQHAMGFIMAIMLSVGWLGANDDLPLWVIIVSALAISIGLFSGGWKVIRNLGSGITRLMAYQGFSASISSAGILSLIVSMGVPVSSTHLTTGTIMGTGVSKGAGMVNWKVVKRMVSAWLITIPCAGIVSFLLYLIMALILQQQLFF